MSSTAEIEPDTFRSEWDTWHGDRERYFSDPLGWVSITGIYWLSEDFNAIADLPGRWRADADAIYAERADGIETFAPVEGAPGLMVADGERRIEVIRRTGSAALRIHDPRSPHLRDYRGIPTYSPSRQWQVTGKFTRFDEPTTVTTGAVVKGLRHHHSGVGLIDFHIDGVASQFVAFARPDGALHVLFTDETSGVTTYPACRSLAIPAPNADSAVTLDFNRAANLPCSFTDFATCPVAPAENRLAVAVAAGEKNPR